LFCVAVVCFGSRPENADAHADAPKTPTPTPTPRKTNKQRKQAYIVSSNFAGVNLTNAVIDRVVFDKADLSGAKLHNAVVTGSTFNVRRKRRRAGGEGEGTGSARREGGALGGRRFCLAR